MAESFATSDDLKDRWPSFPDGQEDYADTLLRDASNMIRERWPSVDQRVADGTLSEDTLIRIVCGMVKRAMLSPDDDGIESRGITTGPFGDNVKYTNPDGNLYFRAADIDVLDGKRNKRAFAVDLSQPSTPGDWCY